jgi:hypothetical protein
VKNTSSTEVWLLTSLAVLLICYANEILVENKTVEQNLAKYQPRSQGFSLFVIGKAGKGPGTGRASMYSDWSMTRTLLCK